MKLKMEKRGMDFFGNEQEWSDCTNHRLFMLEIEDKDGKMVCGDFTHGARYDFSGKKPKLLDNEKQMFAHLQYEDEQGNCWGYEAYRKTTDFPYYGKDFTLANILDYVNGFSKEHYDEVEFV